MKKIYMLVTACLMSPRKLRKIHYFCIVLFITINNELYTDRNRRSMADRA